ncbi:hypothetical protein GALMADRAFT_238920 [Galerina marginata CBS 339.88]|uniref:Uncharacterized protein n=1 Tax=Galerina marginata (strain CBS 339.88) TaxID=685588 RepID=A0A067TIX3_GALM3|nr:hypothetical protein GALMADRAFT_238920 [Galerina marginata CBS 339.88]
MLLVVVIAMVLFNLEAVSELLSEAWHAVPSPILEVSTDLILIAWDVTASISRAILSIAWASYETAVRHPRIVGLLLILGSLPCLHHQQMQENRLEFLRSLGFDEPGVRYDSYASHYQSSHYRGRITRDSKFARYQSYGARSIQPPYGMDSYHCDDCELEEWSQRWDDTPFEDDRSMPTLWGSIGWGLLITGLVVFTKYLPELGIDT